MPMVVDKVPAMTNNPPIPTIAIFNGPNSGCTNASLEKIVAALQIQVDRDFAPVWEQSANLVFVPAGDKPPAKAWLLSVLNNSDQAGALGYHDLTPAGQPLGKVFAGTDRTYKESISVTISHELLEMISDPWINLAAQGADGKFYAYENCDAVEADSLGYKIDGVLCSDFVRPAWFGKGAPTKDGWFDFRGHCTKPFEITSGGYISVFDPSTGKGWTQVSAQRAMIARIRNDLNLPDGVDAYPDIARALAHGIPRVGSRRERRFRGWSNWILSAYETDDAATA